MKKNLTNLLDIIEVLVDKDISILPEYKKLKNKDPFTVTQGGYYCYLSKSIDFLYLINNYTFSENIHLDIVNDSITDSSTWEQLIGINHTPFSFNNDL